jgi:hypothetical protein
MIKRCSFCNVLVYANIEQHESVCIQNPEPGQKTVSLKTLAKELYELKSRCSKMEGEITYLKTLVQKRPKQEDVIKSLNTTQNTPSMKIFTKWYSEFTPPSIELVQTWLSNLTDGFIEYISDHIRQTKTKPIHCSTQHKKPQFFIFEVDNNSPKRVWRLMNQNDWYNMVKHVYNSNVQFVCMKWLFTVENDISPELYLKYARTFNQFSTKLHNIRTSANIIHEIKENVTQLLSQ